MSKASRTTEKTGADTNDNVNINGNGSTPINTKTRAPPMSSLAAFLNALSWSRAHKQPDFDAGLNASSAWTAASPEDARKSLIAVSSSPHSTTLNVNGLSDEEDESDPAGEDADRSLEDPALSAEENPGRPARALYAFEGKPEFRELTAVRAGDRLEVLKEEVGDGWSLVRHFGERGSDEEGEQKKQRNEVGLLPSTYYAVCLFPSYLNCIQC